MTTYSCKRTLGALLTLPQDGIREDVLRTKAFEGYIRDNVYSWFHFAKRTGLDVERMEDLILVTGCTLATSWGVAAFVDSTQDAEVSLRSSETNIDWREISPSVIYQSSGPIEVRPHSQYRRSIYLMAFTYLKAWFFPSYEPMRVHPRVSGKARLFQDHA